MPLVVQIKTTSGEVAAVSASYSDTVADLKDKVERTTPLGCIRYMISLACLQAWVAVAEQTEPSPRVHRMESKEGPDGPPACCARDLCRKGKVLDDFKTLADSGLEAHDVLIATVAKPNAEKKPGARVQAEGPAVTGSAPAGPLSRAPFALRDCLSAWACPFLHPPEISR